MKKDIVILLSSYNGDRYISVQLKSLNLQNYSNFQIIVLDDNSNDNTQNKIKCFNIKLLENRENLGPKKSFMTLLSYALKNTDAEYFMFCDQDDVWKENKIQKTLLKMQKMEKVYGDIPLLIHTDLEVVDEELTTVSSSMWRYEKINPKLNTLNRLLIHNTITGCTMMINRKLALKSLAMPKEAIMHDWWIGLVACCFGEIGYIKDATIKYRQHSKNDTGTRNYSFKYVFNRIKKLKDINIDKNILQAQKFLEIFGDELELNQKNMLREFVNIKEKPYFMRIYILFKYNLFKYGTLRNIGLILKI